jgi:hypothetical protein
VLSSDDPVTLWIDELRNADEAVYDEEDAALSAFHSVCAGIAAGRFPDLGSRGNLWRLLVVITARKVAHRQRHDQQQRRDVHRMSSGAPKPATYGRAKTSHPFGGRLLVFSLLPSLSARSSVPRGLTLFLTCPVR